MKPNRFYNTAPFIIFYCWLVASMGMWFFAFAKVDPDRADWLVRAQAICFGTDTSGMPELYGWMVLILSPLSFLIAILFIYGKDILAGMPVFYSGLIGKALILISVFSISSEGTWIVKQIKAGTADNLQLNLPLDNASLSENYPLGTEQAPDFILMDQYGDSSGLKNFMGTPVILTFAFGHCRTMCPMILEEIKKAQKEISADIPTLVITLDPWRDTPSSLPSIAKGWGLEGRSYIYSGDPERIENIIRDYKVPVGRSKTNGDISHPPMVYIVDPKGRLAYTFSRPSYRWIVEAVERLMVPVG